MTQSPNATLATNTLIIGAGAAGLATAACLRRHRIPSLIVEKGKNIGASWMQRYERLHLHTHSLFSSLPYLSFPRSFPRYPSRLQFAEYLAAYADAFQIRPRFEEQVLSTSQHDGYWLTETSKGAYLASNVVIATGYSNKPHLPTWPGQETFPGDMLHSSRYINGAPYKGKRVLVVGFGNSAGEIAIDLHEHGASVGMAVRNAVNIVPRDLFGLSTHMISVMLSRLPTEVADALSGNLRKLVVGDLTGYGLQKAALGPMTMIKRENRVPLLDVGTINLIKAGDIKIYPGIERFDGSRLTFTDGTQAAFDAVILGTGFTTNLGTLLPELEQVTDGAGRIPAGGRESALPGLYFCGLHNAPAGLLRQIGIEARRIARSVKKKSSHIPNPAPVATL